MTNEIDLTRINKTIFEILNKFPPIQNRKKFEYHRQGKSFFYGLKSSDFNKFEFKNGDRIFNHWKDKLVEMGFLFKIYPKKERGSPYAITPLGIVYLVQNLQQDETQRLNCYNVILHYFKGDKTGLEFDKLSPVLHIAFESACQLVKFKKDRVIFETAITGDMNLTIKYQAINSSNDDSAYYLIGNICWLAKASHVWSMGGQMLQKNYSKYNRYAKNYELLPKEVKVFGQIFGEKIIMPLFEANHMIVKAILNFPNTKNK